MTEEEMQELVQNALQKTLKEIKENPSNVFNYLELQKRYNGVLKDKVKLQQDNKKLNKQLENCYCNRTDCSARIKDSKKYDSLVQRVEKQQKEFINWLEDEIKECDAYSKFMERKLQELKPRGSGKIYIANEIMKSETAKECYKNSLSKYKEIIGVKNE